MKILRVDGSVANGWMLVHREVQINLDFAFKNRKNCCNFLERRAGIEPANTGFADLRVDRFATGALERVKK
jgi:hypothetical protein